MALIPSSEDILRLLDELDKGKVADDLESETLDFKPWPLKRRSVLPIAKAESSCSG